MKKAEKAKGVFSQPVRELSKDEMLKVGGGYKHETGGDNQGRNFTADKP